MVGVDLNLVRRAFEVVTPVFQCTDDTKEFFVVNVVVALDIIEGFGKESAGVPLIVFTTLVQGGASCKVKSIGFKQIRLFSIGHDQDGSRSECIFQGLEGRLCLGCPLPLLILFGEIKESTSQLGEILDKPAVEVAKPKECLYVLDTLGSRPLHNNSDLDRVHAKRIVRDDKSKEFHRLSFKETFLWFGIEVILLKNTKDLIDNLPVLFKCLREDEDVVHVHNYLARVNKVLENSVHHGLEGCRGVHQTKEHDSWFVETMIGLECSFPLISFLDADVVVSPAEVNFGENTGPFELVDEFGNEGKGILVLDSAFVEFTVVLYRAQSTVLLLDKEKGTCHSRLAWTDISLLEVFTNEGIKLDLLLWGKGIGLACLGFKVRFEINSVISRTAGRKSFRGMFVKDCEVGMIRERDVF